MGNCKSAPPREENLFDAVKNRQKGAIHYLINQGHDLNAKDSMGDTPLHWAVLMKSAEIVHTLIYAGADLNAEGYDGGTPLQYALDQIQLIIAKILIDAGSDVNIQRTDGQSALHLATRYQDLSLLYAVLLKGAIIDLKDCSGRTALHIANTDRNDQILKILVDFGADVNIEDSRGFTALDYALVDEENYNLVKILATAPGCEINTQSIKTGYAALHLAVKKKDVEMIRRLLSRSDVNVNINDNKFGTPLKYALNQGDLDIAKILIDAGAFIDTIDQPEQQTALHLAVKNQDVAMIEYLLSRHANVNVPDKMNRTPLHKAAEYFRNFNVIKGRKILELLLNAGANVEMQDSMGKTALHYLVRDAGVEIVEILLNFRPNVNKKDNRGRVPLFNAIAGENVDVVKLLVDRGAELHVKSNDDSTPLHWACDKYCLEIIKFFLKKGARYDVEDWLRKVPILRMAHNSSAYATDIDKYIACLKFLLKYADVNVVDVHGKSMLNPRTLKTKIVLQHLAKLRALELTIHTFIEIDIKYNSKYKKYFKKCVKELETAKDAEVTNSEITYFKLLINSERRIKELVENEDLVKVFERDCVKKFPIYGGEMLKNVKKGIVRRELLGKSATKLSNCLPILHESQLSENSKSKSIIKDILDCLSTKDLLKFCEER